MATTTKRTTKAAATKAATTTTATTAQQAVPLYVLTAAGKRYTPKAKTRFGHHTNWQAITACLQANKGAATLQQLQGLKAGLPAAVQANHYPYIGYCIRRGWLAPAQ